MIEICSSSMGSRRLAWRRPSSWSIRWPPNWTPAKSIAAANPIRSPTASSHAAARASMEPSIEATAPCPPTRGKKRSDRTSERKIFTAAGAIALPKTGASIITPETRKKTSRKTGQSFRAKSTIASIRLPEPHSHAAHEILRVLRERGQDPGERHEHHRGDGEHLRHLVERLVLQLRRRLEHADERAHDEGRQEDRERELDRDPE